MSIFDFLFDKKGSSVPSKKPTGRPTVPKPFDWRQSNPHLGLLSRFLLPQDLHYITQYNYMESELSELPRLSVERFISEGTLVPASLSGKLLASFNAAAIKDLLRQRGLPVSGRKEQGIARLIEADSAGIESLVTHLSIYECSVEAREIVTRFVEEKDTQQHAAEERSMEQLKQKDFRGAMLTVASFEARQVSPRGLSVDWHNYDPSKDVAILEAIFERRPKILAGIPEVAWEPLRLSAAMMHLWGTNRASKWLPSGFILAGFTKFDKDTSCRMISFHAQHLVDLDTWLKDELVKKVEILVSDDSCPACKKIAKKRYKLDKVPELPHEHCLHEMGCRCEALPIYGKNMDSDRLQ